MKVVRKEVLEDELTRLLESSPELRGTDRVAVAAQIELLTNLLGNQVEDFTFEQLEEQDPEPVYHIQTVLPTTSFFGNERFTLPIHFFQHCLN